MLLLLLIFTMTPTTIIAITMKGLRPGRLELLIAKFLPANT
jgi:hypothetical protein